MTPYEQGYREFMKLAGMGEKKPGTYEKYLPWYGAAGAGASANVLAGKMAPGKWKVPAQILGTIMGTGAGVHGGEMVGKQLDKRAFDKYAAPSNLAQDFMAGMDPFGAWTNEYGLKAQRANLSGGEHALKRGVGTVGGVIGGAAMVPSAISGVSSAVKGFSGATGGLKKRMAAGAAGLVSGAKKPIEGIMEATRANKGLKRFAGGGARMTSRENRALRYVGDAAGVPENVMRMARGGGRAAERAGAAGVEAQRAAAGQLQGEVGKRLLAGKTQMGLGGAVGGGGAYYQYGSGRDTERETSIGSRMRRMLGPDS